MRTYAAFVLLGAAVAEEGNPMATVLSELEKLRNNISAEMEGEATVYEDYACYCRDTEEEKSERLTTLTGDRDAQKATIEEAEDKQGELRDAIHRKKIEDDEASKRGNLDKIAFLESEIANADKAEADAVAAHNDSAAELEKAIQAAKDAISALQKGIGITALMQTATVKQAIALGKAMGYKEASFLQAQPSVDEGEGRYNSGTTSSGVTQQLRDDSASREVIGLLQDLHKQFRDELKSQTNERLSSQDTYNKSKQDLSQQLVNENASLEQNQHELAATTELLQNTQKEYSQTTKMIDEDTNYLNDLTNECTLAKQDYDQRSKFSLEELRMLSMVETILADKAAVRYDAAQGGNFQSSFLQDSEIVMKDCNAVHQEWRDSIDAKDDAEVPGWTDKLRPKPSFVQEAPQKVQPSLLETFAAAPAFLQRRMATAHPHNEVSDALRKSAKELGSATLAALATKVDSMAPGVFDRVNTLIRELISRLQKEQSDDIAHHGYCESQMSEMKQARDTAKANMDEAGANAQRQFARSEKLRASINELQIENAETQRAWMEAQRIWQCEKEQDTQMEHECVEGTAAMNEAIDTVSKFFKADHGMDSAGAQQADEGGVDEAKGYNRKGNQKGRKENWANIITLMETMRDELIKRQADSKASLDAATKEYKQFESDSKADMSAKHATRTQKIAERSEANKSMENENEKYSQELQALDSALKMWEDLRKSCQSEGVKPEERAAKRQAEIAALKQALDVLNQVTAH